MNEQLPAKVGDVVEYEMASRFLQSGLRLHYGGSCIAMLLFCGDEDADEAIICRPAPDESIDWVRRIRLELPADAPTRLAVDTALLDRTATMQVQVEVFALTGVQAPQWGATARVSFYTSPSGTAACVLQSSQGHHGIWHGPRLAAFEYDNLGRGIAET